MLAFCFLLSAELSIQYLLFVNPINCSCSDSWILKDVDLLCAYSGLCASFILIYAHDYTVNVACVRVTHALFVTAD